MLARFRKSKENSGVLLEGRKTDILEKNNNKANTSKVGAMSKAQKAQV